ncbi:hypothetical protein G6031_03025 [Dietzia sp. CQ4]|uniref:hypothetical protein n=1 Tax=Dietzia sp. (strain CQ4) TaxID=370437 RepID=UPI0015FB7BDA|nr:hypothetical protein [Dietzia sp. CQ4]MBB1033362.1 hypothetical protein [Dietzia sp. CQ4]
MITRVVGMLRRGRRTVGYGAFIAVTTAVIVAGAPARGAGAGEVFSFAVGVYAVVASTVALAVASRLRRGRRVPLLAGGFGYVCGAMLLVSRDEAGAHLGWALCALLAGTAGMVRCLYPARPMRSPESTSAQA